MIVIYNSVFIGQLWFANKNRVLSLLVNFDLQIKIESNMY